MTGGAINPRGRPVRRRPAPRRRAPAAIPPAAPRPGHRGRSRRGHIPPRASGPCRDQSRSSRSPRHAPQPSHAASADGCRAHRRRYSPRRSAPARPATARRPRRCARGRAASRADARTPRPRPGPARAAEVDREPLVQRGVQGVQPPEQRTVAGARPRKRGDRLVGRRRRGGTQEQRGGERLGHAMQHAVRMAGHHLADHRDLDRVDGAIDVQHRHPVAEAVAPVTQPRVAIDVEAPARHRLIVRIGRRDAQHLHQPSLRRGEAIGGAMLDRQAHGAPQPNLN